ncbi:hypothetical protein FO519_005901 [Halicephalobus sp. NKZ332]|nr:hypothetical protein FO519_005901 [Halicephalobus sp. NKZ332]
MLYVVLKNSKEIGEYKYFIVNQLVWSYLFDVLLGIWKPVPLWPFYMGFGIGFFRSWKGIWAVLPFYATITVGIGMGVSIFMSFIHRYIYISPISWFAKLHERFSFKLFFYGFTFISIESGVMIPVFLLYVDREVLRESITSKYPFMGFFFENEPSIFGYDPALNNQLTVFYMFLILISLVGIVGFSIFMYCNFIRVMRKNERLLSPCTHKMQRTLFRIICIQLCLIFFFLLFPFILSVFFAAFGIRWTSIFALDFLMLCSLHTLADFTTVIYFVRPYRTFVSKLSCRSKDDTRKRSNPELIYAVSSL